MRYLDPKADLTFKKIFGEHKDLVISLINALLPLDGDKQVESVEYLPAELVPDLPMGKNSIVDVRCKDMKGRQFIVEMQMIWTPAFYQRVLFNASKAYVRQLRRSKQYELLQPVYSLNLVNEPFINDYPDEFIHNYNIVHELHSDKVIEGLHLTFVELPKFKPSTIAERKMAVLWLKFLTEIDEDTTSVDADLLANPETAKALKEVEEYAFTESELYAYEDFWDKVGAERLLLVDSVKISREKALAEGLAEGRAEGLAEGRAEGLAKGRAEGKAEGKAEGMAEGLTTGRNEKAMEIAMNLIRKGMNENDAAEITGVSAADFTEYLATHGKQ